MLTFKNSVPVIILNYVAVNESSDGHHVFACSTLCVLTVRSHLRDAGTMRRKEWLTARGTTKL